MNRDITRTIAPRGKIPLRVQLNAGPNAGAELFQEHGPREEHHISLSREHIEALIMLFDLHLGDNE